MFPPPSPWKKLTEPEPEREYVALFSMFPMRSVRFVPGFARRVGRVRGQLGSTRGVVGYSFNAPLPFRRLYTLSAWEDRAALDAFVHQGAHAEAYTAEPPHLSGPSTFIYWTVKGKELPLRWSDAFAREKDAAAGSS